MSRRSLISEYTENIHFQINFHGGCLTVIDVFLNSLFQGETADFNRPTITENH